jgi:hypothetical protein
MRLVPWITLAAAAALFISPLGQDVIQSSFYSNEQLSRTIGQFLLMCILGGAIVLAAIEWGVRFYLQRRRARAANG